MHWSINVCYWDCLCKGSAYLMNYCLSASSDIKVWYLIGPQENVLFFLFGEKIKCWLTFRLVSGVKTTMSSFYGLGLPQETIVTASGTSLVPPWIPRLSAVQYNVVPSRFKVSRHANGGKKLRAMWLVRCDWFDVLVLMDRFQGSVQSHSLQICHNFLPTTPPTITVPL